MWAETGSSGYGGGGQGPGHQARRARHQLRFAKSYRRICAQVERVLEEFMLNVVYLFSARMFFLQIFIVFL